MRISAASAVSPEFNVTTFEPYMLTGWAYSNSDSASFSIGVMTDPDDASTFESLTDVVVPHANTWVEFTVYFNILNDPEYAELYNSRNIVITTSSNTVFFDDLNIGETIGKLVLSIPISCYLFGALFSATRSPKKEMFTYDSTNTAANGARFIPLLVVCTALTPLLIVYLLYFFSQTAYFVSAFSNILPSGFTYAEYARNGFFELCRVSVINLVVIAAAEIFSRYAGKKPIVLKVYNSILSVFTLALMVIAQSKLAMYIRTYGMTPKRVNTFWFSIVLGVVFFFILLYQFIPKINFTRCAAVSFAVLFCALIFSNTDAMIARYNIEKYKSGETKTLDTDLLCYNLSDSAVPVIIEEYDTLPDESPKKAIDKYFTEWAKRIEIREDKTDSDWRDFNLSSSRAEKLILEKYGTKSDK